MSRIEIHREQEEASRWRYDVRVHEDEDGPHGADGAVRHQFDVTLSWADYDHWSHGRVAPQRVVEATFRFLLDREPATAILRKFDCSVIRRYFPEVDEILPGML